MRKTPSFLVSCYSIVLAAALLATQAMAAEVSKARLLYENRLLDDAKRELVDVIASNASPSDQAQALHLLGTIAVDEKRYDSALLTWADLIKRFPDSQDAKEVAAKISLVRTISESSTATPNTPTAPSVNDAPKDRSLRGVIVVGIGTEREFVDQAVTEIMNELSSNGIEVSRAPAGTDSVPELLQQSDGSATSVLMLALRFGYMENLRAHCYSANGRQLWEEKAAGSMGITKAGVTQGLIARILKKIEPHVGDACLPRGAPQR